MIPQDMPDTGAGKPKRMRRWIAAALALAVSLAIAIPLIEAATLSPDAITIDKAVVQFQGLATVITTPIHPASAAHPLHQVHKWVWNCMLLTARAVGSVSVSCGQADSTVKGTASVGPLLSANSYNVGGVACTFFLSQDGPSLFPYRHLSLYICIMSMDNNDHFNSHTQKNPRHTCLAQTTYAFS